MKGVIKDYEGLPYEGAILSFRLNAPMLSSSYRLQNYEVSTTSNRLGRFELKLPANDLEADSESHYLVTLIQNSVREYRVVVPSDRDFIHFDELPSYLLPFERIPELGNC